MRRVIKSIEVGFCAIILFARVPPCSSVKNGTVLTGNISVFGGEAVSNVVYETIWARTCEKTRITAK